MRLAKMVTTEHRVHLDLRVMSDFRAILGFLAEKDILALLDPRVMQVYQDTQEHPEKMGHLVLLVTFLDQWDPSDLRACLVHLVTLDPKEPSAPSALPDLLDMLDLKDFPVLLATLEHPVSQASQVPSVHLVHLATTEDRAPLVQ